MRLLHLARESGDRTLHRRIDAFASEPIDQSVAHFDRPELIPTNAISIPSTSLGQVNHGEYAKRLLALFKAIGKVRKLGKDVDAVYAYNNDMVYLAIMAGLHKRMPVIAQIDDIRHVLTHGRFARIAQAIDRWAFSRVALLVVTSDAFVEQFYRGTLGIHKINWIEVENKIDLEFSDRQLPEQLNKYPIRLLYSGLLRCPVSAAILADLAVKSSGRYEIVLHGVISKPVVPTPGYEDAFDNLLKAPNVTYHGPYTLPQDYGKVFADTDILWACYPYSPHNFGNWRWAKTCRFYQGLFFGKPMILSRGSGDANKGRELGVSWEVDLGARAETVDFLLSLTPQDIGERAERIAALPTELSATGNDMKQLLNRIRDLAKVS